jgi:hypothetical protein
MTTAMKDLRDEITRDPFEDPARRIDRTRSEQVEQAIGGFLASFDEAFFVWIK